MPEKFLAERKTATVRPEKSTRVMRAAMTITSMPPNKVAA
jgi:hypothetical protein